MTLYKWSQTPGSNATADATINWAEGQAPSSINDSARAMMAATAKYRDDIAGAIFTSGSSTAYTMNSYSAFDTLAHLHGQMIAFTPHVTNGAGPVTLNVDGLGAKYLRSTPNVDLLAGVLIQGTPYVALYNNTDGAFYLKNFYGNPYNIPLAAGMDYWGPTTPNSAFAFAVGQAISRTTYATLFGTIGTTYGAGDGSTTFNLPNKSGRVSAAIDLTGTVLTSQTIPFGAGATGLGGYGGEQLHTLSAAEMPSHAHANTLTDPGHAHGIPLQGGASNNSIPAGSSTGFLPDGTTRSATTGISINNAAAGGGGAHNNVQPTIMCNYIIRVF